MRKSLILIIFFLININAYSYRILKKTENNYAEIIRKENENEKEILSVFDAIEKENNRFVKYRLGIDDTILDEDENKKKLKENYGPNYEELNFFAFDPKPLDVNTKDKLGYTPLIKSIIYKNDSMLETLLNNGSTVYAEHPGFGKLSLHTAAYYENLEAVKIILNRDDSIINEQSEHDGWTALQEAVLKNNIKIVEILLLRGADPTLKDKNGGNAIDMAADFGKGKLVKIIRTKIKEDRKAKSVN